MRDGKAGRGLSHTRISMTGSMMDFLSSSGAATGSATGAGTGSATGAAIGAPKATAESREKTTAKRMLGDCGVRMCW